MKSGSKVIDFLKNHTAVVSAIALTLAIAIVLTVLLFSTDPNQGDNTAGSSFISSGPMFDKPTSSIQSSNASAGSSGSSSTINLNDVLGVSSGASSRNSSIPTASDPSKPKVYLSNNPAYAWPQISPLSTLAGKPFDKKGNIAVETGALKYVAVEASVNKNVPFNVACHIENNKITALLPTGTDMRSIKLSFSCAGKVLYKNKAISSGETAIDFSIPQQITVEANGENTVYTVFLKTLETGIPSVSVVTTGYIDILKKGDVTNCIVTVGGGDSSVCYYADSTPLMAAATVKGRGESSWKENNTGKKSFALNFITSQNVLGMGSYKEWALVSNYFDRTLLRNSVGAYLSESFGIPFTMKVRPVDLWMNGVYYGNYSIIEKIAVDQGPVKITSGTASSDPEKVGYLLETDQYISGRDRKYWQTYGNATFDAGAAFKDIFFTTNDVLDSDKIYFSVHSPTLPTIKQANYIYDYMMQVDSAIKSKNASQISSLIDLNSLARWYLTEETMANVGSGFFTSCYMYKDVGKKLSFGPVWDFDLGAGNCNQDGVASATDPYLKDRRWFKQLLEMPVFKAEVKKVWNENKTDLAGLPAFIETTRSMSQKSIDLNYQKWPFSDSGRPYEPAALKSITSYSGHTNFLKNFLTARIAAMNGTISSY